CNRDICKMQNIKKDEHISSSPFAITCSNICTQCDKVLLTRKKLRDHLKYHLKIHSGYKPYQCSQCDKAFLNSGNLIIHMRTHTGDKAFQCNQCDKGFSQN
ncbi:unnamed protein product, partial [Meganyctiphanes norvegica]